MRRRRHNRPKPKIQPKSTLRVNEKIFAREVMVIDAEGANRGVMETSEAIALAQSQGADLVEVSPLAQPPVCKITDYGKLQYRQAKQEQQARAKQKKVEIKGIRIGFRTDKHDLFFKKTQAEKFLTKGHKVRVEIVLRGREKAMAQKGRENLQEFLKSIAIPYRFEEEVKRGPMGFMTLIVAE